jgi:hypothetical protein
MATAPEPALERRAEACEEQHAGDQLQEGAVHERGRDHRRPGGGVGRQAGIAPRMRVLLLRRGLVLAAVHQGLGPRLAVGIGERHPGVRDLVRDEPVLDRVAAELDPTRHGDGRSASLDAEEDSHQGEREPGRDDREAGSGELSGRPHGG